ncbi:unnamed protein product [Symbiodinium pilosum]|uniref:C3H1-type domain-containing protein n=1 Tax=Symbiodinium pilosum TaxID=2952 RepID=A0A812X833_SYMPI|nr:unnamed protein product [Symbiodinium pilosum]
MSQPDQQRDEQTLPTLGGLPQQQECARQINEGVAEAEQEQKLIIKKTFYELVAPEPVSCGKRALSCPPPDTEDTEGLDPPTPAPPTTPRKSPQTHEAHQEMMKMASQTNWASQGKPWSAVPSAGSQTVAMPSVTAAAPAPDNALAGPVVVGLIHRQLCWMPAPVEAARDRSLCPSPLHRASNQQVWLKNICKRYLKGFCYHGKDCWWDHVSLVELEELYRKMDGHQRLHGMRQELLVLQKRSASNVIVGSNNGQPVWDYAPARVDANAHGVHPHKTCGRHKRVVWLKGVCKHHLESKCTGHWKGQPCAYPHLNNPDVLGTIVELLDDADDLASMKNPRLLFRSSKGSLA